MNQVIMAARVVTVAVETRVMMMKATTAVHPVVQVVQEVEAIQEVALEDRVARDKNLNLQLQAVPAAVAQEAASLVQAAALTAAQEQRAEVVNQNHPSKNRM